MAITKYLMKNRRVAFVDLCIRLHFQVPKLFSICRFKVEKWRREHATKS